jgi:hypothetical protein
MANFWQTLQIAEAIFSDISAYSRGTAVSTPAPVVIGNETLSVTAQLLPNGPADSGFQVLGGTDFYSILVLVFADLAGFVAGAPLKVAIKVNTTWNGVTLTLTPKAPAAA